MNTIKKKVALIAGLTAALLTSGCFIERTVPMAVYPEPSYDEYYAANYGSGYDSYDGYTTPTARPTQPIADRNNRQPILQGLNANPGFAVAPGQTITFTVSAHDPDGDALQYTWSATGGMLSADSGQMVAWIPPAERGIYTVQVLIADGRGGTVKGSQNIMVDDRGMAYAAHPSPQPSPEADVEPAPVVTPQPSPRPTPSPRATPTPMPIPTPTPVATPSPIFDEWVSNDDTDEEEDTEL